MRIYETGDKKIQCCGEFKGEVQGRDMGEVAHVDSSRYHRLWNWKQKMVGEMVGVLGRKWWDSIGFGVEYKEGCSTIIQYGDEGFKKALREV